MVSGDVWVVIMGAGELLTPNAWRPGMLLSAQDTPQRMGAPNASSAECEKVRLSLRDPVCVLSLSVSDVETHCHPSENSK